MKEISPEKFNQILENIIDSVLFEIQLKGQTKKIYYYDYDDDLCEKHVIDTENFEEIKNYILKKYLL